MDFISPFFFLGAFQLLRQAFQDMKSREIDYDTIQFMNGIVIFLYLILGRWMEGILILLVASFGLNILKNAQWIKENLIGLEDGDILTLVWVIAGTWLFGLVPTALFVGMYVIALMLMHKKGIQNIPVIVPITVSFILTWTFLIATKAISG